MTSWATDTDSVWEGPEWAAPERAERIRLYPVEGEGPQATRPLDMEVTMALAEGAVTAEQYQAFRAARHRQLRTQCRCGHLGCTPLGAS